MKKGYFIALEGGEGTGKSTVGKVLELDLKRLGLDVLFVREPGGTTISEEIRKILKNKEYGNMSFKTEILLFLAARAQIVEEKIRPHLERGGVVVADRFRHSTEVYQGFARGLGVARAQEFNDFATEFLQPDLTLLYDIDPQVGLRRKGKEGQADRLDSLSLDFHNKIREGYLKALLANEREGRKWYIIDAGRPLGEVIERSLFVVRERLVFAGLVEAPNIRKEAVG